MTSIGAVQKILSSAEKFQTSPEKYYNKKELKNYYNLGKIRIQYSRATAPYSLNSWYKKEDSSKTLIDRLKEILNRILKNEC